MVVGMDESKVDVDELQHYEDSSADECDTPAGVLSSKFDKTDLSINTNPLPHGKYTLIGIDIDTTGRRLIDEIVQISAFTPERQYAQYIMPLMNLNPAARQRHQVRVITVGFFRMLKSMQTYRVMKTKMEVAVLNEFIDWLEAQLREDEGSDGIVLVYHEQRKFVPYMVIEALKKYKLLDRFAQSVKSFANGFKLAEEKCTKTIKYLTIRQLAMIVLDEKHGSRDGFEGNAAYRAKMAFEISRCLATAEPKETTENISVSTASATETEPICSSTSEEPTNSSTNSEEAVKEEDAPKSDDAEQSEDDTEQQDAKKDEIATAASSSSASRPLTEEDREKMCAVLCEFASPISTEISELDEQENILARQNSLRPVFLLYFKTTIYHRVKAVTYRRVLAECGHDYESLRQVWQEKKREGVEAIINEIAELKEDERIELIELLDCHYDPEKQAFKPIVKRMKRRPSRGQPFFSNKNGNVPQNQNVNQMVKENRKPFNTYNQKNHNNNQHHNGNNMMNKPQHQQQQQQFYNNQSSPDSGMRNGGSPGKRFYQRNSRRRRGANGQNQNQNGAQNQQPMKNHNGNHQTYSNSNRHNHQFQQQVPSHA